MECAPTARLDFVIVAWCVLVWRLAVPSVVLPSLNVTVPVGPDAGETVAVKVTAAPLVDGFKEEASFVAVEAFFTVCACAGEVLPPSYVSPL
jgi:hypothetical protein